MHQGQTFLDLSGKKKEQIRIDDLLEQFNQISIECGN